MKVPILLTLLWCCPSRPAAAAVSAPLLKWQHGGCYTSWCETGWYSSPAVADLDGDGAPEVVASAYSIVALEGATGALEWRVASGHDRTEPGADSVGRTWPGIAVEDLDDDGDPEIASAHGGGWVSVYRGDGYFEEGWPRQPIGNELRSLAVGDLDRDGTFEIAVGAARGNATNAWVLEHDGTTRPGWPQVVGDGGYSWGVYNDNIALADLEGDAALEVIVPSDVHYICSYDADGAHLVADTVYGGKNWGEVGVWESFVTELRGWGMCNGVRAESYRTNFADGPATVADLDGDGEPEVVATGRTYDCTGGETTRYTGVYVFQADRGRFVTPSYDWSAAPVDLGAPLSMDYDVIESASYNPAVADLDGDGELEILFSDFAGKLHAFWLDRSEHGAWPYSVYSAAEGFFRFASEPVVADLDADGDAEVLVTSWTQKGSGANGALLVLSAAGALLHAVPLPPARSTSPTWNGALAAPTLANLDADADLEVVIQTAYSGVVAYDLPGTASARILWGTGRGSFTRAGTPDPGGRIFRNGFETGTTVAWSLRFP
ncbi:MAG: VCBS repeat-containing protein [Thermoanaerobaculia bacterium]|nr:VCBS repeat-containing protein [Thermoanaerobaculia bacterium]